MASGATKTEAKRSGSMASGSIEPRQKRALWLQFLTEAKSFALLTSPQYASVREPVQNIKNNHCQSPFLHWWFVDGLWGVEARFDVPGQRTLLIGFIFGS